MTDSDCAASARVMRIGTGRFEVTAMATMVCLKPGAEIMRLYGPGGTSAKRKLPIESDVVPAGEESGAVGCKRIVALGITAPEGSCTMPDTTAEDRAKTEAEATQRRRIRMESFRPGT